MGNIINTVIRLLMILPFIVLGPVLIVDYFNNNEVIYALLFIIGEFAFIVLFYALYTILLEISN